MRKLERWWAAVEGGERVMVGSVVDFGGGGRSGSEDGGGDRRGWREEGGLGMSRLNDIDK